MPTYIVPENLAGKTLSQLRAEQDLAFRPDVLASFGGVSENTPLTAGQAFNLPDHYANSGESQGLTKMGFTLGGASGGGAISTTGGIVDQAKELARFTAEQNKPVIASIEAQRQPLIDRYQALLDQIKGNQATAEQRQSIATSQEFGKRGIPLSSGMYNEALTEKLNPITSQYTNLYKETGAGREQDLLSLSREIASLQSGNPAQAINQSLQFGQYQQGAQSLAAQIAYQQQQMDLANREFGLKEKQFKQDPYGLFG